MDHRAAMRAAPWPPPVPGTHDGPSRWPGGADQLGVQRLWRRGWKDSYADLRSRRLFTLTHELVHLFLGESALDDAEVASASTTTTERWCNQVAAEVLIPLATLQLALRSLAEPVEEL